MDSKEDSQSAPIVPSDKQKGFYISIAPQGDVELILQNYSTEGTYTYTYCVSSEKLCVASPVFQSMFDPRSNFSEAAELRRVRQDGKGFCKVNAESCDPNALAAVLKIFHDRTQDLPHDIEFKALVDVAVICDYYDCASAVKSWAEIWMKPWKIYIIEPGYDSWIFIAKVFRDQESYSKIASHLILRCAVENGKLVLVEDNIYRFRRKLGEHIPHDELIARRNEAFYILQSSLRSLYSRYTSISATSLVCKETMDVEEYRTMCDYVVLGYLHSRCPPLDNSNPECFNHLTLLQLKETIVEAIRKMPVDLFHLRNHNFNHLICMVFGQFITDMQKSLDQVTTLELPDSDRPGVSSRTKKAWEVFVPVN